MRREGMIPPLVRLLMVKRNELSTGGTWGKLWARYFLPRITNCHSLTISHISLWLWFFSPWCWVKAVVTVLICWVMLICLVSCTDSEGWWGRSICLVVGWALTDSHWESHATTTTGQRSENCRHHQPTTTNTHCFSMFQTENISQRKYSLHYRV